MPNYQKIALNNARVIESFTQSLERQHGINDKLVAFFLGVMDDEFSKGSESVAQSLKEFGFNKQEIKEILKLYTKDND